MTKWGRSGILTKLSAGAAAGPEGCGAKEWKGLEKKHLTQGGGSGKMNRFRQSESEAGTTENEALGVKKG